MNHNDTDQPEHGVQDGQDGRAAHDAEVGRTLPPHFPDEHARRAHVHEESLEIALVPAGALLDPVDEVAVGLLEGDRLEDPHRVTLANIRMPRSASSVTLYGSQPPRERNARRRKWFDVPPNGIGACIDARPGRKKENHMAYSMVNHLVIRFWSALL